MNTKRISKTITKLLMEIADPGTFKLRSKADNVAKFKHSKLSGSNDTFMVVYAQTPGDHRGILNMTSHLRRKVIDEIGLENLPPHWGEKGLGRYQIIRQCDRRRPCQSSERHHTSRQSVSTRKRR